MIHSRALKILAAIVIVLAAVPVTVLLLIRSHWAAGYVERHAIEFLERRLEARVTFKSLQLDLYPRVAVSGTGLSVVRHDSSDGSPFVAVQRFSISGSPWTLPQRRVSSIELDGVDLFIRRGGPKSSASKPSGDVLVDTIVVRNGRLVIVPSKPGKQPLEFALHEVTMKGFGFDRSAAFAAQITNPKPTSLIQSEGHIGPWDGDEIGSTPLSGVYLMANGDLGSIKGIGGQLESSGKFEGILERIRVEGTTSSKNFHLMLAEHAIPLETQYIAIVDGTNGDTILEKVDATLGSSHLAATGSITSTPGVKGRSIILQVTAKDARFEDLLRLAIGGEGQPPMRGLLNLNTSFVLPPSEEDVPLRLQLKGTFAITRGHFASDLVQDKLDELSRRGQGQPGNQEVDNVMSAFGGTFALNHGVLTLPNLRFSVNGARVDLKGNYGLPTQALAFRGTLSLDAPVSKTVTGFKSILLKAVDPLFRRNGAGTQIPIVITGTVAKPAFKVETGRIFKRG